MDTLISVITGLSELVSILVQLRITCLKLDNLAKGCFCWVVIQSCSVCFRGVTFEDPSSHEFSHRFSSRCKLRSSVKVSASFAFSFAMHSAISLPTTLWHYGSGVLSIYTGMSYFLRTSTPFVMSLIISL